MKLGRTYTTTGFPVGGERNPPHSDIIAHDGAFLTRIFLNEDALDFYYERFAVAAEAEACRSLLMEVLEVVGAAHLAEIYELKDSHRAAAAKPEAKAALQLA